VAIPDDIGPLHSYYNPRIWDDLRPAVMEQRAAKVQELVDGRWKKRSEAKRVIGYIQALDWLIETATDLTRVNEAGDS
jgi:hypothetical protein